MAVVVIRAAADQVAVDDAGLVDKRAAAHFEIELALAHRGHPPAAHAVGPGRNLDAMADAADLSAILAEMWQAMLDGRCGTGAMARDAAIKI